MKIPVIHPVHQTKLIVDVPEGYCLKFSGEIKKGDKYLNWYSGDLVDYFDGLFGKDCDDFYFVVTPDPKNQFGLTNKNPILY